MSAALISLGSLYLSRLECASLTSPEAFPATQYGMNKKVCVEPDSMSKPLEFGQIGDRFLLELVEQSHDLPLSTSPTKNMLNSEVTKKENSSVKDPTVSNRKRAVELVSKISPEPEKCNIEHSEPDMKSAEQAHLDSTDLSAKIAQEIKISPKPCNTSEGFHASSYDSTGKSSPHTTEYLPHVNEAAESVAYDSPVAVVHEMPLSEVKCNALAVVATPRKPVQLVVERPGTYIGRSLITADSVEMKLFTYENSKEFVMKEKLFSSTGDGFKIKDAESGKTVFQTKNSALSMTSRKKLLDVHGNCVYTVRDSRATLHDRVYIKSGDSQECEVQVKRKSNIPGRGRRTMEILRGADKSPWIEAKGDITGKNFTFTETQSGKIVGTVTKTFLNVHKIVFDKDSYIVRVCSGVDCALMVILTAHLDEKCNDRMSDTRKK